jgi:hypothetical protein
MPSRRLKCKACQKEATGLLYYSRYGSLCPECFKLAVSMEALITKFESAVCPSESDALRSQIHIELKHLALQLQSRVQEQDQSAGKKPPQPDHQSNRLPKILT